MKKILSVMMAGLMVFSAVGCSESDKEDKKGDDTKTELSSDESPKAEEKEYSGEEVLEFTPHKNSPTASVKCTDKDVVRVKIPDTVEIDGTEYAVAYIETNGFKECAKLEEVIIPDSVAHIAPMAFISCEKLDNVTIPGSVEDIGVNAFTHCISLTTVEFNDGLKKIDDSAFGDCGLTSLVIPDSVTTINKWAFEDCKNLTDVKLSANLEKVSYGVFQGCESLENVEFGNKVETIGEYAFSECNGLKTISIPSGVKEIEKYAFACCSSLTELTIPASVTHIGEWFVQESFNLKDIYMENTEENDESHIESRIDTINRNKCKDDPDIICTIHWGA